MQCCPSRFVGRVAATSLSLVLVPLAVLSAPGATQGPEEPPQGRATASRIVPAASCRQGDVQAAIDAARDGDTVLLPAGEATWTPPGVRTPSVVISDKVLTLQGAGIGKTIITDGSTEAWNSLALVVQGRGKPFRVTGITFRKGTDARGANAISIHNSRGWRVDNCAFDYNGVGGALYSYGDSFGVMDSCTVTRAYTAVNVRGRGDDSWKEPVSLGTANAVYVEDCTFVDVWPDGVTDGYDGARYVFRHNTITQSPAASAIGGIGHHGFDSGGIRSTFSCEVYANTFTGKGWVFGRSRGGTGVVFDNTVAGEVGALYLLVYYRSSDQEDIKRLVSGWGAMCDGTNPLDGNEDATGYPGRDQPGRATDAGRDTPQLLEPVYAWGNTLNGKEVGVAVQNLGGRSLEHIKEGRDFINGTPRPGYRPYAYPHPLRSQWPPAPPTDTQKPTPLADLKAQRLPDGKVELTWAPATDDVAVSGYHVWLNGRKVATITDPDYTRYTFLRLKPPLEKYAFAVSASDNAGNESEPCASTGFAPAAPEQTP